MTRLLCSALLLITTALALGNRFENIECVYGGAAAAHQVMSGGTNVESVEECVTMCQSNQFMGMKCPKRQGGATKFLCHCSDTLTDTSDGMEHYIHDNLSSAGRISQAYCGATSNCRKVMFTTTTGASGPTLDVVSVMSNGAYVKLAPECKSASCSMEVCDDTGIQLEHSSATPDTIASDDWRFKVTVDGVQVGGEHVLLETTSKTMTLNFPDECDANRPCSHKKHCDFANGSSGSCTACPEYGDCKLITDPTIRADCESRCEAATACDGDATMDYNGKTYLLGGTAYYTVYENQGLEIPNSLYGSCVREINYFRAKEGLPALKQWKDKEACTDRMTQYDRYWIQNGGHAHKAFVEDYFCTGLLTQNSCHYKSITGERVLGVCIEDMWEEKRRPYGFTVMKDGDGNDYIKCNGNDGQCAHYIYMRGGSKTADGKGFTGYNDFDRVSCGFYWDAETNQLNVNMNFGKSDSYPDFECAGTDTTHPTSQLVDDCSNSNALYTSTGTGGCNAAGSDIYHDLHYSCEKCDENYEGKCTDSIPKDFSINPNYFGDGHMIDCYSSADVLLGSNSIHPKNCKISATKQKPYKSCGVIDRRHDGQTVNLSKIMEACRDSRDCTAFAFSHPVQINPSDGQVYGTGGALYGDVDACSNGTLVDEGNMVLYTCDEDMEVCNAQTRMTHKDDPNDTVFFAQEYCRESCNTCSCKYRGAVTHRPSFVPTPNPTRPPSFMPSYEMDFLKEGDGQAACGFIPPFSNLSDKLGTDAECQKLIDRDPSTSYLVNPDIENMYWEFEGWRNTIKMGLIGELRAAAAQGIQVPVTEAQVQAMQVYAIDEVHDFSEGWCFDLREGMNEAITYSTRDRAMAACLSHPMCAFISHNGIRSDCDASHNDKNEWAVCGFAGVRGRTGKDLYRSGDIATSTKCVQIKRLNAVSIELPQKSPVDFVEIQWKKQMNTAIAIAYGEEYSFRDDAFVRLSYPGPLAYMGGQRLPIHLGPNIRTERYPLDFRHASILVILAAKPFEIAELSVVLGTFAPTESPTPIPTGVPTLQPTPVPTTARPSSAPTEVPTREKRCDPDYNGGDTCQNADTDSCRVLFSNPDWRNWKGNMGACDEIFGQETQELKYQCRLSCNWCDCATAHLRDVEGSEDPASAPATPVAVPTIVDDTDLTTDDDCLFDPATCMRNKLATWVECDVSDDCGESEFCVRERGFRGKKGGYDADHVEETADLHSQILVKYRQFQSDIKNDVEGNFQHWLDWRRHANEWIFEKLQDKFYEYGMIDNKDAVWGSGQTYGMMNDLLGYDAAYDYNFYDYISSGFGSGLEKHHYKTSTCWKCGDKLDCVQAILNMQNLGMRPEEYVLPECNERCHPPTEPPTPAPTHEPTASPTAAPVEAPKTEDPTSAPTDPPTANPTATPTAERTPAPTGVPTPAPTQAPVCGSDLQDADVLSCLFNVDKAKLCNEVFAGKGLTNCPATDPPTGVPTDEPTASPTANPTDSPAPTMTPQPTGAPTHSVSATLEAGMTAAVLTKGGNDASNSDCFSAGPTYDNDQISVSAKAQQCQALFSLADLGVAPLESLLFVSDNRSSQSIPLPKYSMTVVGQGTMSVDGVTHLLNNGSETLIEGTSVDGLTMTIGFPINASTTIKSIVFQFPDSAIEAPTNEPTLFPTNHPVGGCEDYGHIGNTLEMFEDLGNGTDCQASNEGLTCNDEDVTCKNLGQAECREACKMDQSCGGFAAYSTDGKEDKCWMYNLTVDVAPRSTGATATASCFKKKIDSRGAIHNGSTCHTKVPPRKANTKDEWNFVMECYCHSLRNGQVDRRQNVSKPCLDRAQDKQTAWYTLERKAIRAAQANRMFNHCSSKCLWDVNNPSAMYWEYNEAKNCYDRSRGPGSYCYEKHVNTLSTEYLAMQSRAEHFCGKTDPPTPQPTDPVTWKLADLGENCNDKCAKTSEACDESALPMMSNDRLAKFKRLPKRAYDDPTSATSAEIDIMAEANSINDIFAAAGVTCKDVRTSSAKPFLVRGNEFMEGYPLFKSMVGSGGKTGKCLTRHNTQNSSADYCSAVMMLNGVQRLCPCK